jgi:protein-S-isoprenylcysteine O-methyltransferase Ste14
MIAIRTLIFTVLVPGSVTIWIPYLLLSSSGRSFRHGLGTLMLLGAVPMVLGVVIYLWCAWDFVLTGKGTPAPWDPPGQVVSRGLYQMTRNPMYLGVGLILLGEAILFQSLMLLAYAGLIGVTFHLFIVCYEEPTLRRKFGAAYEAYCQAVPRWIPWRRRAKE